MKNNTREYYSPKQGRLPVFIAESLEICDPVLAFDRIMEEIEIEQYLKPENRKRIGRPGYNRVNMLKTILYGFMDTGYVSLRELEDRCKVNLRYMYLMDSRTPSYHCFGDFINAELREGIEDIFKAVMEYIGVKDHVDMQHIYIDGTKLEANANKYSWVWRKGTEKSRYKLYGKVTALLSVINEELIYSGLHIETGIEYTPEQLFEQAERYAGIMGIDISQIKHGRGHRKTEQQRHYETLTSYARKLSEYTEKLRICGTNRNSYSKTDHDATFMRLKCDHMKNDQLLPSYNIQIAVADEYIVAVDVQQYRSDMDCFIPLMEKYRKLYGYYPKYPIADAGYGSFNNYIYCQIHGMEKYMKFPMYDKEANDEEYKNNPFRAVNFKADAAGNLVCPNGKKLRFAYRKAIKGNLYGRQEEVYECEDCGFCPYAEQCKKGEGNRTASLNRELTAYHLEVLENLQSTHGALLRMNRSIQAEGTFGIMKQDRNYKRIVRRGLDFVRLELYLVSIGHNLYKYYNKSHSLQRVA